MTTTQMDKANRDQDLELVNLAKSGDSRAFSTLYNKYNPYLTRLLKFKLKGSKIEHQVEDIVQEAMSKAFEKIASYTPEYTFKTWIVTITLNKMVDFTRKKPNKYTFFSAATHDPKEEEDGKISANQIVDSFSSSSRNIEKDQAKTLVELILNSNKMSEKYKQIIIERHLNELSYAEIAQKYGMEMGTLKANLHRAMKEILPSIVSRKQVQEVIEL